MYVRVKKRIPCRLEYNLLETELERGMYLVIKEDNERYTLQKYPFNVVVNKKDVVLIDG